MSKGWESKSVEEQQAEAAHKRTDHKDKSDANVAAGEITRKIQALQMQRELILNQRTSSPHRRSALELALATIERDLELLGMSIKL